MRRSLILPLVLHALAGHAQMTLPLHEAGPGGTLLLGDNIETFAILERSLRTVTIVAPGAVDVQRVRRFMRYRPDGDDATAWPTHLAARLERPVEPGAVYLEGDVKGIVPFRPEERTAYFWQGDTLAPMLLAGGRDLRYIWKADANGEHMLVLQELNDHNVPREVTNYHVRRPGCRAQQHDSVAVVHCAPDDAYATVEPAIVFVLVNGEPVHAWRERADADPSQRHRLLATLSQGDERMLIFSTGEVLLRTPHRWSWKARMPMGQDMVQRSN